MELTPEDKMRYARQIAVPEINREGQLRLKDSKVFIIGGGALGSMVAMQLAGAGVGKLGLADYDRIDISNLQRQYFFETSEAGKYKVEILAERIRALNPEIETETFNELITAKKAAIYFQKYDFIVDATDNPDSKRMTGDLCKQYGKACCIGGVRDFNGQIMTFLPDDPRFEDYFGEASGDGFLPCSLGGVIGPAAVFCASIQAAETIKYIIGKGELLSGNILIFSLLNNTFQTFRL